MTLKIDSTMILNISFVPPLPDDYIFNYFFLQKSLHTLTIIFSLNFIIYYHSFYIRL